MASTRKGLVGVLLVCALAGLGAQLALREHGSVDPLVTETAKATKGEMSEATSAKGEDERSSAESSSADKGNAAERSFADKGKAAAGKERAASGQAADGAAQAAVKPEGPPLDRPLRVISLGWDLAVPGHLANKGTSESESAFAKRKLDVEIKSSTDLSKIKSALANGGAHKSGADIAILPLPEMVASYEDLRALKPQIFFVVGWSRGRDALFARKRTSLLKLPRSGSVSLAGTRGSSAMLLSLYLLDIAGVDSKRLRISGEADRGLMFSAVDRGRSTAIPKDMRIAVTSADASALIPFVAIAPEGFLQNRRAITAWIAAWLEGAQRLEADVPAAARQVSGISGAPETVTLVRRLGLIEFSGLRDNVRRAGLAGRDPVTLSRLFQLSWRLWRGVDVLTTPAPKSVPLAFAAISSLVLENPGIAKSDEGSADFTTRPLFRGVASDMDAAALVAGVFARSSVRVGAFGKRKRSADALEELTTRYGLNSSRFEAKASLSKRKTIVLEVYSAP